MKYFARIMVGLALIDATFLALASPTTNGKQLSSVVIFGDSYTDQEVHQYRPDDNGEVAQPGTELSTGGRVWPQYIKQYSGANIYDYAVSGAICDSAFAPPTRNGVKQNQIPSFLADNVYVNSTGHPALYNPPLKTVYAIWIGTNDLGNRAFFTDSQPRGLSLTAYTDCVFEQLDRLYAIGARRFVLLNIAPLHLSPQYAPPENDGVTSSPFWEDKAEYGSNLTSISEKMRQYSTLVNEIYEFQIPYQIKVASRYAKSQFALFDVHALLTDIWDNPASYLNGSLPLNVTGFVTSCADSTCPSKDSRDSFMWYDELHPSEQTDRVIAKEFLEVVAGGSKWATYWRD
ncbi:hypothetical protein BDV06DRAFT_225645 [Aspergillus oleicola]